MHSEQRFEWMRTAIAIGIALLIAYGVILVVSETPIETLLTFIAGPLKSKRYLGNVIELSIPLMFSGVATAILFQAKLFNLGAEGLFYICGLVAAILVINLSVSPILALILSLVIASIVGGVAFTIPGYMRAKWGASELVTSLMFNSIFYGVGLYFLNYYFRDPNQTQIATAKFPEGATLMRIISGTRIHAGLIIAIIVVILTHLFLYKTKWGYALRMTGINPNFASYSGINTVTVILYAHIIAGLIAGLGGAVEVLGMYSRFTWQALPGLGFDGALVAMLAKNKPLNVIVSALFIAYIRIGADLMARLCDVSSEMVAIIQAIIILLISAERFLYYWRQKMLLKEVTQK